MSFSHFPLTQAFSPSFLHLHKVFFTWKKHDEVLLQDICFVVIFPTLFSHFPLTSVFSPSFLPSTKFVFPTWEKHDNIFCMAFVLLLFPHLPLILVFFLLSSTCKVCVHHLGKHAEISLIGICGFVVSVLHSMHQYFSLLSKYVKFVLLSGKNMLRFLCLVIVFLLDLYFVLPLATRKSIFPFFTQHAQSFFAWKTCCDFLAWNWCCCFPCFVLPLATYTSICSPLNAQSLFFHLGKMLRFFGFGFVLFDTIPSFHSMLRLVVVFDAVFPFTCAFDGCCFWFVILLLLSFLLLVLLKILSSTFSVLPGLHHGEIIGVK